MDSNTVTAGDFDTPLSSMDINQSGWQWKINKETAALNDTLDQMNLINIFEAFHPKAAQYTFFSSIHEIFLGETTC